MLLAELNVKARLCVLVHAKHYSQGLIRVKSVKSNFKMLLTNFIGTLPMRISFDLEQKIRQMMQNISKHVTRSQFEKEV